MGTPNTYKKENWTLGFIETLHMTAKYFAGVQGKLINFLGSVCLCSEKRSDYKENNLFAFAANSFPLE